jgi:hypothetical protein
MMVLSPPQVVPPEDPRASEDPNTRIASLEEVIKCISKSMEAMKKTNKDPASWLPPWKQIGHEERRKPAGKGKAYGEQEESSVHGEENSSNKKSHQTQQSSEVESSYRPSRCSRSHYSRTSKMDEKKGKEDQDMKDLKEKYNRMILLLENGEGQSTAEHLMTKTTLPFTNRVMKFQLPDKFKNPRVDKYDGSGDPSNHIEGFRAHLVLHGTLDEIVCRAFPLTLKGVAKDWFGNLKPQSIYSFDMLGRQFLNQFLAVRRRKKSPAYLLSLVQGKKETLKDYLHKFNQEKFTVENPDDQTILSA